MSFKYKFRSNNSSSTTSTSSSSVVVVAAREQECHLDELGYYFVKRCVDTIEARGLEEQGLYRVSGVSSRINKLLQMCLNRRNYNKTSGRINMPDFSDPIEWETKTITSALKHYLRNLSEPLMTYNLHPRIIEAAKIEDREIRSQQIKTLIQQLPSANFSILKILVEHLRNVSRHSQRNKMTVSNLGICFAPTLMRGPDEPSITEICYSNVVTNTLIDEYNSIFGSNNRLAYNIHDTNNQLHRQNIYLPSNNYYNNYSTQQQQKQNDINYNRQLQLYLNHSINNTQRVEKCVPQQTTHHYQANQIDNVYYKPYHQNSPLPRQLQQPTVTISLTQQLPPPFCEKIPWDKNSFYPFTSTFNNDSSYQSDRAISLYPCNADLDSELSFASNEMIIDVEPSAERGWLVGTLERSGQRGLVPENYVKFI